MKDSADLERKPKTTDELDPQDEAQKTDDESTDDIGDEQDDDELTGEEPGES
ncbi:MAG TPA: hypothetical protein VFF60_06715 [Candidatus Binatus sp.]|nr:hypothetical protein [Candidatus Binatus sp.]